MNSDFKMQDNNKKMKKFFKLKKKLSYVGIY